LFVDAHIFKFHVIIWFSSKKIRGKYILSSSRLERPVFDWLNWFLRSLENLKYIEDRRLDRSYGLCRS